MLTKEWIDFFATRTKPGPGGCILWTLCTDALGYGRIIVRIRGHKFNRAHRLSWYLQNGDFPPNTKVLHRCDVRNCVNADHLFLGTQADNIADMVSKGRNRSSVQSGSLNGSAKLDEATVLEIREALKRPGVKQVEVAREFGASVMTISRIARRLLWSHI